MISPKKEKGGYPNEFKYHPPKSLLAIKEFIDLIEKTIMKGRDKK